MISSKNIKFQAFEKSEEPQPNIIYSQKIQSITKDKNQRRITGSYLVLTPNIPDGKADVLIFHSLHIEPCNEVHLLDNNNSP
jgi:hypothetical protein